MSYFEKIDIYIPKRVHQTLKNDAELFEIFKKDKGNKIMEINLNSFVNILIKEFYNTYITEYNDYYDNILHELNTFAINNKDELAEVIINKFIFSSESKKRGTQSERLSFKATDKSGAKGIIDSIGQINDSVSQYLGRMLIAYSRKSLYERERIIFKNIYDRIMLYCRKKQSFSFTNSIDGSNHTVMPYSVSVGKEELFNYLLCYTYDEKGSIKIYTYRLSRITNIIESNIKIPYSDDVKDKFELIEMYGSAYAFDEGKETCVLLNKAGISSFRQIYFGRPKVEKKEETGDGNYRYYFNCSQYQLYLYFRRFNAGEAFVEYPKELQDKIRIFHEKSLDTYKSGKLSND